jgi:hypothetical protein
MINRDELLKSFKTGNFLNTVYDIYRLNYKDHQGLVLELTALHNEKLIDIVDAFESLSDKPLDGPDFFMTRRIFEEILPNIYAPILSVMHCVLRLYRSAGQDLAAGSIIDAFMVFCKNEPSRPYEALKEIEANPEQLADLLTATIISGSHIDSTLYLSEAIRLSEDKNIELRKHAVLSIGKINCSRCFSLIDSAYTALSHSIEIETDDQILANSVRSVFALFQQNQTQETRAFTLIGSALSKGGEITLYAASEVFGFHMGGLPVSFINLLIVHLMRVKPTNKWTLNNIDYGIQHLVKEVDPDKGIQFLEGLLLKHHNDLTMEIFDSTTREILGNNVLISKILTRWFLRGDQVLCNAVYTIVEKHLGDELLLEIDPSELISATEMARIIFIARKAIGYLFMIPISAASILISLMRNTMDKKILNELSKLLFNLLLLNYPSKVGKYVTEQSNHESNIVKEVLNKTLDENNKYLDNLRSASTLTALHPSEEHREAHRRHLSHLVEKSLKVAEEQSDFLNLVSKSVVLYGKKSINYVYGSDGQCHRTEIPLHIHDIEMEFPRMEVIDPIGLNYMLRIFRNERFKT